MKKTGSEIGYQNISPGPSHKGLLKCCHGSMKWKIISFICFSFTVAVIVVYNCLDTRFYRSCCQKNIELKPKGPFAPPKYIDDNDDVINDKIRYKHTKRRLPNCIIIGVRKGGTRALLEFVNLHPNIQTATNEIHFFNNDDNYDMGYDWYRKKMPFTFPGQITVEKTPAYFVSEETPERVHKMNSSIKLLLVVRDPTQRAISDYAQIHDSKIRKNLLHPKFENLAIDSKTGQVRRQYAAIKRGIYHRHLAKWLRYFSLNQILVLSAEKLVSDPISVLKKVEVFLGIPPKISSNNIYFNRTRGFYCMRNETYEKCLSQSKGRKHPDVDPVVVQKLHDFYRPHNQKFYDMVGRDFGWP